MNILTRKFQLSSLSLIAIIKTILTSSTSSVENDQIVPSLMSQHQAIERELISRLQDPSFYSTIVINLLSEFSENLFAQIKPACNADCPEVKKALKVYGARLSFPIVLQRLEEDIQSILSKTPICNELIDGLPELLFTYESNLEYLQFMARSFVLRTTFVHLPPVVADNLNRSYIFNPLELIYPAHQIIKRRLWRNLFEYRLLEGYLDTTSPLKFIKKKRILWPALMKAIGLKGYSQFQLDLDDPFKILSTYSYLVYEQFLSFDEVKGLQKVVTMEKLSQLPNQLTPINNSSPTLLELAIHLLSFYPQSAKPLGFYLLSIPPGDELIDNWKRELIKSKAPSFQQVADQIIVFLDGLPSKSNLDPRIHWILEDYLTEALLARDLAGAFAWREQALSRILPQDLTLINEARLLDKLTWNPFFAPCQPVIFSQTESAQECDNVEIETLWSNFPDLKSGSSYSATYCLIHLGKTLLMKEGSMKVDPSLHMYWALFSQHYLFSQSNIFDHLPRKAILANLYLKMIQKILNSGSLNHDTWLLLQLMQTPLMKNACDIFMEDPHRTIATQPSSLRPLLMIFHQSHDLEKEYDGLAMAILKEFINLLSYRLLNLKSKSPIALSTIRLMTLIPVSHSHTILEWLPINFVNLIDNDCKPQEVWGIIIAHINASDGKICCLTIASLEYWFFSDVLWPGKPTYEEEESEKYLLCIPDGTKYPLILPERVLHVQLNEPADASLHEDLFCDFLTRLPLIDKIFLSLSPYIEPSSSNNEVAQLPVDLGGVSRHIIELTARYLILKGFFIGIPEGFVPDPFTNGNILSSLMSFLIIWAFKSGMSSPIYVSHLFHDLIFSPTLTDSAIDDYLNSISKFIPQLKSLLEISHYERDELGALLYEIDVIPCKDPTRITITSGIKYTLYDQLSEMNIKMDLNNSNDAMVPLVCFGPYREMIKEALRYRVRIFRLIFMQQFQIGMTLDQQKALHTKNIPSKFWESLHRRCLTLDQLVVGSHYNGCEWSQQLLNPHGEIGVEACFMHYIKFDLYPIQEDNTNNPEEHRLQYQKRLDHLLILVCGTPVPLIRPTINLLCSSPSCKPEDLNLYSSSMIDISTCGRFLIFPPMKDYARFKYEMDHLMRDNNSSFNTK